MDLVASSVLITGGSGSLGSALARELLKRGCPRVCIYSRGEHRQAALRAELDAGNRTRWFIGDVRDRERLRLAMRGVDVVIHAAALKRVEVCEDNPLEAVATNVMGTAHVVTAAIEAGVSRVLFVSSDKQTEALNVYGKSKALAEAIAIQGNAYAGRSETRIAAVRYGNVAGSQGSVVPVWRAQAARAEPLTMTDPEATRFWITMEQAVAFVLRSVADSLGGEVFVPVLPASTVGDLARAVAPKADWRVVGLGPGEKRHEVLIAADEYRPVVCEPDRFVVLSPPAALVVDARPWVGGSYSSDSPAVKQLTAGELRDLLA